MGNGHLVRHLLFLISVYALGVTGQVEVYTECPVDIVFLLDASSKASENTMNRAKSFIQKFTDRLVIDPEDDTKAQLGVVTFAGQAQLAIELDSAENNRDFAEMLKEEIERGNSERNLAAGLRLTYGEAFDTLEGARKKVGKLVVIVINGFTNQEQTQTLAEAKKAKEDGLTVMVVAVGEADDLDVVELEAVASSPADDFYYNPRRYSNLNNAALDGMVKTACKVTSGSGGDQDDSIEEPDSSTESPVATKAGWGDIAFVLDGSGSVGEDGWEMIKTFVKNFALTLKVGQGEKETRIGVVSFGNTASLDMALNSYENYAQLAAMVDKVKFKDSNTNTAAGLRVMRTELFDASNGNRNNVPDIAIVVTDGKPTREKNDTLPEAKKARDAGIAIFTVGIGEEVDDVMLREIASDPDATYAHAYTDFEQLIESVEELMGAVFQTLENVCTDKDLTFVIDSSGSIGRSQFVLEQKFVKDFTSRLRLGPDDNLVAAVGFSSRATVHARLGDHDDHDDFRDVVDDIPWMDRRTNVSGALKVTREWVYQPEYGDRSGHPNIAVILSDGYSTLGSAMTAMEAIKAHQAGIRVFVVGVGFNQSMSELQVVASSPPFWHIALFEEFDDMNDNLHRIYDRICAGSHPSAALSNALSGCQADLSVILDSSAYVGTNFKVLTTWVRDLANGMPTNEDGMLGLVSLGESEAQQNIIMGTFRSLTFVQQLSRLKYRGGKGDISDGFRMLRDVVFAPSGNSRADVTNIALAVVSVQSLLNGGKTAVRLAEELRNDYGVTIIIVAVGEVDEDELEEMQQLVGSPQEWMLQIVASYAHLAQITALVQGLECTASAQIVWSCGFQDGTLPSVCQAEQLDEDTFDWTVHSGATRSRHTGPSGAYEGSHYAYIEASKPRKNGDDAILLLEDLDIEGYHCLYWQYHMWGWHTGLLQVFVRPQRGDDVIMWMTYGPQKPDWLMAYSQLVMSKGERIGFRATRAKAFSGDIAIDDIKIKKGACPDQLGYSREYARYLNTGQSFETMSHWPAEAKESDTGGTTEKPGTDGPSETTQRPPTEPPTETTRQPTETTRLASETPRQATGTTHRATGTTHRATETTQQATGTTQQATGTTHRATETTQQASEATQPDTETTHRATETTHRATETTQPDTGTTHRATETTQQATDTTQRPTKTTQPATDTTQRPTETTQQAAETAGSTQASSSSATREASSHAVERY